MSEPAKDPMAKTVEEGPASSRLAIGKVLFPISLMVALILVTMGLALSIAPLYDAMGLSAGMSEYTDNPLFAFVFLAMMVGTALLILLLRKLLKKRRLKLKYVLAVAVALSTMAVLEPVADIAFNGAPSIWKDLSIDAGELEWAVPLDPSDLGKGFIAFTESSFVVLEKDTFEYKRTASVLDLNRTYGPHFRNGTWLISAETISGPALRTVATSGEMEFLGVLASPRSGWAFLGAQIEMVGHEMYIASFWGDDGNGTVLLAPSADLSRTVDISDNIIDREGPFLPVQGWSMTLNNNFISGNGCNSYDILRMEGGAVKDSSFGFIEHGGIRWGATFGGSLLLMSNSSLETDNVSLSLDGPHLRMYPDGEDLGAGNMSVVSFERWIGPDQIWYSIGKDGEYQLLYIEDKSLTSFKEGSKEEYVYSESIKAVVQGHPDGRIWIVTSDSVFSGKLGSGDRGQWYVSLAAILSTCVIMFALMRWPKWWLVDLCGILMGAGVTALMGISFPIAFTLVLLVLLAIYDFISVYKTKHMIVLADSVVEAKMPILLVFPMKWSYRYEDQTNIMEPKRKRESLFMGLGDVIIPGILVLSAFSFLPLSGGAAFLGKLSPNLFVAVTTLMGMMVGFSILMFFVVKGKAHAGLPPLNGGAITGFIVGHLIAYGSLPFM